MPIWLRKFTFSTLREYYENQNKEEDLPIKSSNTVAPPDIVQKAMTPTYNTKASNK